MNLLYGKIVPPGGIVHESRLVSDIKMSVYILQMSKIDYNYNNEGGLQ